MSDTSAVNSGGVTFSPSVGFNLGITNMSADALLAYCQSQLGDLDSQVNAEMSAQRTSMREREAVQSAQSVLNQFGTNGPQTVQDFQKCVNAVNSAIAQLPPGDPVAGQLAQFRDQMCATYHYQPPRALTVDEQSQLQADQAFVNVTEGMGSTLGTAMGSPLQSRVQQLQQLPTFGTFAAPDKDSKQWSGTTDSLGNIADDIKSSAEIQMLHLQDLVSQRQQAVQLCTGMMTKTDQTLEEQAKAIGG